MYLNFKGKYNKRKVPKVIAFYLPQFYRIQENDRWWGKGFTDWVAVKQAKPLFKNHTLPRKPLRGYYNLLSKDVLMWQNSLAKKSGIYGFCFYHYWFKDGKRLLEKPAELLLQEKDIDMKFCFSWANEAWIRTWSNLGGNAWADKYDDLKDESCNKNVGVLMEQEYGLEKEWKQHFEYLYPFFVDSRYIKFEGKPVFIIYRPNDIPRLAHMIRCWNKWAKEKGLKGIYFIGTIHSKYELSNKIFDAELLHSPNSSMSEMTPNYHNNVKTYSYDEIWKCYLKQEYYYNRKRYLCACVDYDTTPRKGNNGIVIHGMTPDKWYYYLKKLIKLSEKRKNEFMFINAWNEWGESMYLEPDTTWGYDILMKLRKAIYRK